MNTYYLYVSKTAWNPITHRVCGGKLNLGLLSCLTKALNCKLVTCEINALLLLKVRNLVISTHHRS